MYHCEYTESIYFGLEIQEREGMNEGRIRNRFRDGDMKGEEKDMEERKRGRYETEKLEFIRTWKERETRLGNNGTKRI